MKNIETILKDSGIELTDEQKTAIVSAVNENYKTIAEYQKIGRKVEAAETERDSYKTQLETANETIKKFDGIDPEKIEQEIAGYKQAVEDAKANAAKSIEARDQKDFLNAEFDKLGITSARTRKSLMDDIMGEDGLKWKNGQFMGLTDYLASENEKDHFYKTAEEIETEKKQAEAKGKAPSFTQPSQPKEENKPEIKPVAKVW